MTSHVTETPAAAPETALRHFEARLAFETDCWDVYDSLKAGNHDFVVVDVRGRDAFDKAHVPSAINIPHRTMTKERMAQFADDTLFVVYCAGPHCNGANKAAVRLAKLGYKVKEMIGGVTGWQDEGFPFQVERESAPARGA
jgi:rhodanese-related sulfurtransferase